MIGEKCITKGYNEEFINDKIKEVYEIPRITSYKIRKRNLKKLLELPIIMNFHIQHRQVERMLKKHWSLLKADRQLQSVLTDTPRFIYRRAATLKELVAKNVPDPSKKIK